MFVGSTLFTATNSKQEVIVYGTHTHKMNIKLGVLLCIALAAASAMSKERLSRENLARILKREGGRYSRSDSEKDYIGVALRRAQKRSRGLPVHHASKHEPRVVVGLMGVHERMVVDEHDEPKQYEASVSRAIYGVDERGRVKKLAEHHMRSNPDAIRKIKARRRQIAMALEGARPQGLGAYAEGCRKKKQRPYGVRCRLVKNQVVCKKEYYRGKKAAVSPSAAASLRSKKEDGKEEASDKKLPPSETWEEWLNEMLQKPAVRIAVHVGVIGFIVASLLGLGYLIVYIIFGPAERRDEARQPLVAREPVPANAAAMRAASSKSSHGKKYAAVEQV